MFFITISNGLIVGNHRKRMGEAVWEFMWCLDRMTSIDEKGVGKVLGGKPIKIEEIACEFLVHNNTVIRNLKKLEKQGYINIKRAPYGVIITVNKAKKRYTKSVKRNTISVERNTTNGASNKTVSMTDTKTDPLLHASHVEEKKECEMHSFIFPGGPCRNCPVIQNKLPEKKSTGGFKRMFEQ